MLRPNSLICEDLRPLGDLILKLIFFNVFPLRYQVISTWTSFFYTISRATQYKKWYLLQYIHLPPELLIWITWHFDIAWKRSLQSLLSERRDEIYLYSTVLITHGIISVLLASCSSMRGNLNLAHWVTFSIKPSQLSCLFCSPQLGITPVTLQIWWYRSENPSSYNNRLCLSDI